MIRVSIPKLRSVETMVCLLRSTSALRRSRLPATVSRRSGVGSTHTFSPSSSSAAWASATSGMGPRAGSAPSNSRTKPSSPSGSTFSNSRVAMPAKASSTATGAAGGGTKTGAAVPRRSTSLVASNLVRRSRWAAVDSRGPARCSVSQAATGATRRSMARTRPSEAATSMSTPDAGPPSRSATPGPSLLPTHPALSAAANPRNPRTASTVASEPMAASTPPRHSWPCSSRAPVTPKPAATNQAPTPRAAKKPS